MHINEDLEKAYNVTSRLEKEINITCSGSLKKKSLEALFKRW